MSNDTTPGYIEIPDARKMVESDLTRQRESYAKQWRADIEKMSAAGEEEYLDGYSKEAIKTHCALMFVDPEYAKKHQLLNEQLSSIVTEEVLQKQLGLEVLEKANTAYVVDPIIECPPIASSAFLDKYNSDPKFKAFVDSRLNIKE